MKSTFRATILTLAFLSACTSAPEIVLERPVAPQAMNAPAINLMPVKPIARPGNFKTQGVAAPRQFCPIDPQLYAKVEALPDTIEGNGCGYKNAFKLYEVAGVKMNPPAITNCNVITSFNFWFTKIAQPQAISSFGEPISEVRLGSTYACRPRNNVKGGKLSEHGMANAIDIMDFTLRSGTKVDVKKDYYSLGAKAQFLRAVRRRACGPFHTVLGPGSDASHHDHLHFDMQRRKSRKAYCR